MPKQPAKKVITSKKSIPAVEPAKALPVKKSAAKVASTPVAAPPAPAKQAKPAPVAPAKAAPVAAKAPAAPKARPAKVPATTIVVNYDAGFGNLLFLRGEGTGLSWDKGVEMGNLASDEWIYTIEGASSPLAVKVLVNDMLWSSGANVEVPAGQKTVITPIF